MKIKTLLIASMAATLSLATSCNEIGPDEGADGKSVIIKLDDPATRALGDKVGSSAVTFTDGYLFFVSQSGQITRYFTIGSAATSETNINLTELRSAGVEIKNVADNSKEVYILGNIPSTVTVPSTPVGMNISAINELKATVRQLADGTGGVTVIPLYGKGTINTTPTPATANVSLEAVASRIEIEKFDLKAGAEISKYQIDGIFVNAYYNEMQLDGTLSAADMVDNGTENDANTKYLGGSTAYPNGLPLWDHSTLGIGSQSGTQFLPSTAGKVWAYNVFPGVAPHIVVRLSGVEYTDGTKLQDPQYLTARTYNGGAVTTFVKGKAYLIESFLFDENDLTDKPEVGVMDVKISVTLLPWSTEKVTPDL